MVKVSFTGSRTYNPKYFEDVMEVMEEVMDIMDFPITYAYVGGAIGVDMFAAEYCIKKNIPYTIVLPFKFHTLTRFWDGESRKRLCNIIDKADDVFVLGDSYSKNLYHERNKYLVDSCEILLAFPTKGSKGTFKTISLAKEIGKRFMVFMEPQKNKRR